MVSDTAKRDANTLKVDATPSGAWKAVAQFVRECGAPPGEQWGGLDAAARGSISRMRMLGAELESLARGFGKGVHVERASLGLLFHEVAGLVTCEISIDLSRLQRPNGDDASARLTQLLLALERLEGYRVRVRLGRRPCSLDDAIRAISDARAADPRRADDRPPPSERARRRTSAGTSSDGPGPKRTAAGAGPRKAPTGAGPRASSTGAGPRASSTGAGPRASSTGAGPRASSTGAGREPPRSPPGASSARAHTWAVEVFLRKTGVRPPFTAQALKKAFRINAAALHPDHRPHDPGANEEFRLFKEGYEQLRAQVMA